MSSDDDLKRIIEHEKALIFSEFDELVAWRIGCLIREMAVAQNFAVSAEVRKGPRPLFHMALPGTVMDNVNWMRRKANVVHLVEKSSYRVVLEKKFPEDYFPPNRALDMSEYVLAGGGFPVRVKGAGMIASVTVSGLAQRDDHRLVVAALCEHLGMDAASLNLPAL